MTQEAELVESPFGRRHIQATVAVAASTIFVVMTMTLWRNFKHQRDARWAAVVTDPQAPWALTILTKIDLNTAEPRELALLPGVGPILADRIVRHRAQWGPFRDLQDLGRVHGIGPKTLQRVGHLCVCQLPPSMPARERSEGESAAQRLALGHEPQPIESQDTFDRSSR